MASSGFRVVGRPEDRVTPGGTASSGGGGGSAGVSEFTFRGEPDFLDVTVDPVAGIVETAVADVFKGRVSALEQFRSLLEIKDSLAAGGPQNYMNLPGATGDYISTPSHTDFNVLDDMCVIARILVPAAAPAADMTIAARYNTLPNNGQWRLLLTTTGFLRFVAVNPGGSTQSIPTALTALSFNGAYIWVKCRRRASDGDTGFWTATDTGSDDIMPTSWTALTLNRGSTPGALWNNAGTLSVPLTVGAYNGGASFPWTGRIGRVLAYDGLDETTGTLIADSNAADYVSGSTWTGPAGRVWTINGAASVVLIGGRISNSTAEFSLGESDPFPSLALANHDTLLWSTEAILDNTSGSSATHTFKIKVAGVDLFTPDPIVIPSNAGKILTVQCAVKLSINSDDGTTQIASAQLVVGNPVTGTSAGSISMASPLVEPSGVRSGAITTITSIPQIQLRLAMGTAAPTIGATPIRTELFVAKA
jgi:hypothetical protein